MTNVNTVEAPKMSFSANYGEVISNDKRRILETVYNEMPVLKLDNGQSLLGISASFTDIDTANAFVAQFPKYCNLKVRQLTGLSEYIYHVSFPLGHDIKNDNVAGAFNETAIKRVSKQLDVLETIFN